MQLTEDLKQKLNSIEEFRQKAQEAIAKISTSYKLYADIDACNFLQLLRDHTQAILVLAYHEVVYPKLFLLPSALALSRTVLETFARLIWLIEEEEPDIRVQRTIAMLNLELKETKNSQDKEILHLHINNAKNNLLDKSKSNQQRVPKYTTLLKKIGGNCLTNLYNQLCKSVHGSHEATWIYHHSDEAPDPIKKDGWYCPLFICHYTYIVAIDKYLKRFGGDNDEVITKEIRQEIEEYHKWMSDWGKRRIQTK